MGDRRPSFPFRFWTSATSRRTGTAQTASPRATTSTPAPPPKTTTKAGSQSPPTAAKSSPTVPPSETENQKPEPSTTTTQPTTNNATSGRLVDEPQTSSPSRAITKPRASLQPASPSRRATQSRSPPQSASPSLASPASPSRQSRSPPQSASPSLASPASPSRRTTQSKSPPQPSSPSRAAPQTRSKPSSPSRMGSQVPSSPQRTAQPHSPPHLASRSLKQASSPSTKDIQPTSPSKKSTQEISKSNGVPIFDPNEEGTKLAASQQEPLEPKPNEEVKSDRAKDSNGLPVNETSINHEEMKVMPSKSSEKGTTPTPAPAPIQELDYSTVNGESLSKSNANPEETKEVKEVVQVANTESNEETEEVSGFLAPESGSENTENPSESNQMQLEKQEIFGKKENLAASSPNTKPTNTTSQPRTRDMTLDYDKKSALPNGEKAPLYKEIREDISTFVNRVAIGDPKNAIYDKPVSVITLAGENRGASMHLGTDSSKKEGSIPIHRGYKINPDESMDITTDGEETSKEDAKAENTKTLEDQPPEAYVNNNAQSINNSLVFNCSITERNPGVHMVFTHLSKESIESTDKSTPLETRKAEFNPTTPDKLTYEPTIRRRCLKGLFLEPSDSETENPEKPRRHGCRVGCKERDKPNEIDVLST